MPQFDFGNVFWPQIAWLAVIFMVLYFGVVRLTLPKLGKVMDTREASIAGDLAAAKAAKESADAVDESYHAEMNASREAARGTIAEAKAAAAKATEVQLAKAGTKSDTALAAAEARIAKAVTKAEAEIAAAAATSAQAIVAKLTGVTPGIDAAKASVAARI